MGQTSDSKLSRRIRRLRWQAAILAVLLVLGHQLLEHTWLIHLARWQHFATQLLFYGLIGPVLAWWALTSLWRSVRETEAVQRALTEANQRLEFLIEVNRRLAEADDEETLTQVMLELPLEVVPVLGCSLIRFDERGQPLPAIHRGDLDPAAFEAWAAHLSAAETREQCQSCTAHWATDAQSCPLLAPWAAPGTVDVRKVYCLPLTRGVREFGVLNLYLAEADRPDAREQDLLEAMAQEMSLALESQRLRSRELDTLFHLQQARRLSNLHDDLAGVVGHTVEALEADGGILFLADAGAVELQMQVEAGQPLAGSLELVRGLAGGVQHAGTPLLIGDLEQEGSGRPPLRSLLMAPLRSEARSLGSLVLWAARSNAFTRRQVQLVATVAGQAALVVENYRLYLQAEYQAALDERDRLAREIHDGLAQTLGYLKLRTAQIATWLEAGDVERARANLEEVRALLGGVYVDAREAIDGLRLKPGREGLNEWLNQALLEFEDLSGIKVEATPAPTMRLSPEVQTQLLRIVQEALSNVRKHSGAAHVRLEWQTNTPWLVVRISDDGQGFDLDDVPPISRHGLRIMRERAELLDADFQIVSQPGAGTQVVVSLPIQETQPERDDA